MDVDTESGEFEITRSRTSLCVETLDSNTGL